MTRDGDQAIRGSWLRAVSSLLSPPFAVHIFHRLEILFARSAAKLSRFEIFMNGSDTPTTLDPAAQRKGTAATPHQRPLSPPSPPPPSSSAIARDLRLVVKLDDACPCLFVRDPISSPPSSAPSFSISSRTSFSRFGIVYGIPRTEPDSRHICYMMSRIRIH